MCGYQPVARRRMVDELVSVDTAAAVTGVSKRTLWRWLGSGSLQRQGMDERGRVMVAFSDIAPRLCVAFAAPSGGGGGGGGVGGCSGGGGGGGGGGKGGGGWGCGGGGGGGGLSSCYT